MPKNFYMTWLKRTAILLIASFICGSINADSQLDANVAALQAQVTLLDKAVIALTVNQAIISVGVIKATSGQTVTIPINFIPGPKEITGFQATVAVGSSITVSGITSGPVAVASGKSVAVNGDNFVVFGLNQTSIGLGNVANLSLSVPAGLRNNFYTVTLINPVATDSSGNEVLMNTISGTVRIGL